MNNRIMVPRQSLNIRALPGLLGWWDASDTTTLTIATGVSAWADKSGNGLTLSQGTGNAQPISGSRTIGGKNALDFDGSNDAMSTSFSLDLYSTRAFSVFVVCATDTTAASVQGAVSWERTNCADFTTGGYLGRRTTLPEVAFGDGRATDAGPAGAGTSIRRFSDDTTAAAVYSASLSQSANTVEMRKNNVAQSLTAWYGSLTPTGYLSQQSGSHRINVGGLSTGASDITDNHFNGVIGEVIFCRQALSSSVISAVNRYLMAKWGVT